MSFSINLSLKQSYFFLNYLFNKYSFLKSIICCFNGEFINQKETNQKNKCIQNKIFVHFINFITELINIFQQQKN